MCQLDEKKDRIQCKSGNGVHTVQGEDTESKRSIVVIYPLEGLSINTGDSAMISILRTDANQSDNLVVYGTSTNLDGFVYSQIYDPSGNFNMGTMPLADVIPIPFPDTDTMMIQTPFNWEKPPETIVTTTTWTGTDTLRSLIITYENIDEDTTPLNIRLITICKNPS